MTTACWGPKTLLVTTGPPLMGPRHGSVAEKVESFTKDFEEVFKAQVGWWMEIHVTGCWLTSLAMGSWLIIGDNKQPKMRDILATSSQLNH